MSDAIGIISTLLGIIVTVTLAVKWLFNFWYEKEQQLANHKHELVFKQIKEITEVTDNVKRVISAHSDRLKELQLSVEKSYMRYNAQTDSIKAIGEDMKESGRDLRSEIKSIQTQIIELGKDVAIYKSKKS